MGLFGIVSFGVTQRTRELGIRSALGATPLRLMALVTREVGMQLGIGLGLGVLLAGLIAPAISAFVLALGVDPHEPFIYGIVIAILSGAAALAALGPALRAARLDAGVTLRSN
jgi:ABC-type antimicrobial peptide transport system permease subunit